MLFSMVGGDRKVDFKRFSEKIEEKKVEIVEDTFSQNYVLMVMLNKLSISQINFESFEVEDIWDIYNGLEQAITDEDTNGEISLNPKHPYAQIMRLGYKISAFCDAPKERVPSPFMFL